MSKLVDERVVQMSFDNSKFDKNVRQSMDSISQLKASLDFSAVEVAAITAISNITNKITDMGLNLAKSLSIDNITAGWSKYESKTKSIGTLLAQGLDEDLINEQVDYLSWYTDETSYSFDEMFNSITKFTATGIELENATSALIGVANWAAMAGQNSATASAAMYQLSQAMSSGYIKYQDWQQAAVSKNMVNVEIEQILADAALSMTDGLSTLKKIVTDEGDELYQTLEGKTYSLSELFSSDALTGGLWLTKDVFLAAMKEIEGGTKELYETWLTFDGEFTTSELMKNMDETEIKFFKAAQEARSLADAIGAIKEASASAWSSIFENIFGTYSESVKLWTELSNKMYKTFVDPIWSLQSLLSDWKEMGGMDALFKFNEDDAEGPVGAFWNLYEAVEKVTSIVSNSFTNTFGVASEQLYNFTLKLQNFSEKLIISDEYVEKLTYIFGRLFNIIKKIFDIATKLVKSVLPIFNTIVKLTTTLIDNIYTLFSVLENYVDNISLADNISKSISILINSINNLFDSFLQNKYVVEGFNLINSAIITMINLINELINALNDLFDSFNQNGEFTIEGFVQGVNSSVTKVKNVITKLASNIVNWFNTILDINSPSRVMRESGKYVVDGLTEGIVEESKILKEKVNNIFVGISDYIKEKLEIFNKNIKTLIPEISDTITNLVEKLYVKIKAVLMYLNNVVIIIYKQITKMVTTISAALEKMFSKFAMESDDNPIVHFFNSFIRLIIILLNVFDMFIPLFEKTIDTLLNIIEGAVGNKDNSPLLNLFTSVVNLFEALLKILLSLIPMLTSVIDLITNKINTIVENPTKDNTLINNIQKIVDIFINIFNIINLAFGKLLDTISTVLNNILSSVKEVETAVDETKEAVTSATVSTNIFVTSFDKFNRSIVNLFEANDNVTQNTEEAKEETKKTKDWIKTILVALGVLAGLYILTSPIRAVFNVVKALSWMLDSLSGLFDAAAALLWVNTIRTLVTVLRDITILLVAISAIDKNTWETGLKRILTLFGMTITYMLITIGFIHNMIFVLKRLTNSSRVLLASLKKVSSVINALSSTVIKFSVSIAILTAALASIAWAFAVYPDAAETAADTLGLLVTIFTVLEVILVALNVSSLKLIPKLSLSEQVLDSLSKMLVGLSGVIIKLGTSILLLSLSLVIISKVINDKIWKSFGVLVAFLGTLLIIVEAMVISLFGFIKVFKIDDATRLTGVSTILDSISVIIASLASSILLLSLSLTLVTLVINKYSTATIWKSFGLLAAVLGIIAAFIPILLVSTKTIINSKYETKLTEGLKNILTQMSILLTTISTSLLGIFAGLALVTLVINKYNAATIWKSFGLLAAVLGLIAAFMPLLLVSTKIIINSKSTFVTSLQAVNVLKSLSAVMLSLAGSVAILAGTFALIVYFLRSTGIEKNNSFMTTYLPTLLLMIGTLVSLTIAFGILAKITKTEKTQNINDISKNILAMTAAISAIVVVIGILAFALKYISPTNLAIAGAAVITTVGALIAIVSILGKFSEAISKIGKVSKLIGVLVTFAVVIGIVTSLIATFAKLTKDVSVGNLWSSAGIFAIIIAGLIGIALLSTKLNTSADNLNKFADAIGKLGTNMGRIIIPITILIGTITALIAVIKLFKSATKDTESIDDTLTNTTARLAARKNRNVVDEVLDDGEDNAEHRAVNLITTVLKAIQQTLTEQKNVIRNILQIIVSFVFEVITDLINELTNFINSGALNNLWDAMCNSFVEGFRTILKYSTEFIDILKTLIEKIGDFLLSKGENGKTNIYNFGLGLASVVGDLLLGLIDGLIPRLDELTTKLIEFIINLLDRLGLAFYNASGTLGNALGIFIIRVFGGLAKALTAASSTIISMIFNVLSEMFRGTEFGDFIAEKLIDPAKDAIIENMYSKVAVIDRAIERTIDEATERLENSANDAGANIANYVTEGYVKGMAESTDELEKTGEKVGQIPIDATRKILQIKSPSRVFEQIGRYIDEGLAIGIEDELNTVSNAIALVSDTVASGLDDETLTIRPVIDLSDVETGTLAMQSMLNNVDGSIVTSSTLAKSTKREINNARKLTNNAATSDDIASLGNVLAGNQNGDTINNVFNITGSNAKEIANEVNNILQKQLNKGRTVYGN